MSTIPPSQRASGRAVSAAGGVGSPKRPSKLSEASERPQPGTVGPVRRVGRKVASLGLEEADALVLMLTQAVREEVRAQQEMRADCDPVASRNYRRAVRKRELCENRIVRALLTEYTQ